jgi:MoaA/NifB/PqqE/SkfB family radical SAM enzyme
MTACPRTIEAAISPSNKMTFLLDWELTMKCNLDCSYCTTGIDGGHDNTTNHPPVDECLKALDFMYEYVDIYMSHKPAHSRHVVLNVYGGESLFHPNIVELLEAARSKHVKYKDTWSLTITTTTNAIVGENQFRKIVELIDEFTVSYHTENLPKQKEQFKKNLLLLKEHDKRVKCIVLMHPDNFEDNLNMIDFCTTHDIKHLPRQLDHGVHDTRFNYKSEQVIWFDKLYKHKSRASSSLSVEPTTEATNLTEVGRACCGGRQMVSDQNYSERQFFVQNKFPDWYCSVNWFFLFVKQVNGNVFVNKDCKMRFDGTVGPIGNLSDTDSILQETRERLSSDTPSIIQCKKELCLCGLCAPKSKDLDGYTSIMRKYTINQQTLKDIN